MKRKFRIGVIGAGAIAQACHIPGYARARNCLLAAVADPAKKCLRQVKRLGYDFERTYADYREMLARESLDAVSVCTPNAVHKEAAVACIKSGADVLLEKPVAVSLQQARAIQRAAEAASVRVMVAFSNRFREDCVKAKRTLDAGAIGKPYMVRVRLAHLGPAPGWAKTDWFYNPELAGGGALLDMGIHAFDLVHWLIGPPKAVQAKVATLRKRIEVEDNAVALIELEKDCLGYVEAGWTSPAGFVGVELMGDKGAITIDYGTDKATITTGRLRPSGKHQLRTRVLAGRAGKPSWQRQMEYFTGMLGKDEPFEVGMEEGIDALKVALAAYKSSRTGRRIRL